MRVIQALCVTKGTAMHRSQFNLRAAHTAALLLLVGLSALAPAQTKSTTRPTSRPSQEMGVYENKNEKFKLAYPKAWVQIESPPPGVSVSYRAVDAKPADRSGANVNVVVK